MYAWAESKTKLETQSYARRDKDGHWSQINCYVPGPGRKHRRVPGREKKLGSETKTIERRAVTAKQGSPKRLCKVLAIRSVAGYMKRGR